MLIRIALLAIAASMLPYALNAQEAPTTDVTEQAEVAPTWSGLPFSSLAEYEQLVPIGMS